MNFLNALERIPKLVEQYKAQNVTYERVIPILQETVGGVWKKEDELKALKADVAALERKIQLTLAPPKIWSRQEKTEKTKLMNGQGKENLSQDIIYHSYIGLEKREVLEIIKTPNRSIKI